MKIARFTFKKNQYWGVLKNEGFRLLKDTPYKGIKYTNKRVIFKNVKLLPPANPSKIVLVGLNYKDHARELGMSIPKEPIIFLKPPTTLIGHKDAIVYPRQVKRLDYEAELAIVIKKKARNISRNQAKRYILGFTCLNDVTARDLQKKDGQWSRAKSFDTFCSLGPWVETELNPSSLGVQLCLNGKLKQNSSTKNLSFSAYELVAFISGVMTLLPGDVISTGTPSGVGPMKKGDKVEVTISGIGTLTNKVR